MGSEMSDEVGGGLALPLCVRIIFGAPGLLFF